MNPSLAHAIARVTGLHHTAVRSLYRAHAVTDDEPPLATFVATCASVKEATHG